MPYARYDAHRHVTHDAGAAEKSVVNGTSPDDWAAVITLAKSSPAVIPAIGLHPWRVNEAPDNWQAQFLNALPNARAIGEIGLDHRIDGHNIDRQEAAFCWQLKQATVRNLPVSIHCLKAGDALLRVLRRDSLPRRGIHLHAYSGSAEQVAPFAALGAYFSFHAGQFKTHARKAPTAARAVPVERLLIETDAPNTLDKSTDSASFLKHGYEVLADLRGISPRALYEQVSANFRRYFTDD